METAFGSQRGSQNTLSAVATLAYDCRRSAYFTDQLNATLTLIDRGVLSASTRGSMHGEIGQTQFLPKNILNYGSGNLDVAANALTSTANFLKAHGWRAGAGYQPGKPISRRSRHGTRLRFISAPLRLWADRLTEEMASPRSTEFVREADIQGRSS